MGFFRDLFGAGGGSVPAYDMEKAKDMYNWTLNKGRYGVNNGLAGLSWDADNNTLNLNYGPKMQGVLGSLFGGTGADKRAEESVFKAFSDKYEPTFERQNSNLKDSLINQGLPVGSEAYTRATADMAQTQNDARQQAAYQSVQAGQQARNNEINQGLGIFSAFNPLNGYTGTAAQGDTGIYDNYYKGQWNAYNQNQQNAQNMANGWLGLGTSGLNLAGGLGVTKAEKSGQGGLFSDARIKENLRPVGDLYNGLTVYAFNFPGERVTRIGLVAQEVEQLLPQAVSQSEEGLLMVDYDAATQYEQDGEENDEHE